MQCPVRARPGSSPFVSRGAWSPSSSRCPPPATPCRPPPTPSAPPAPVKARTLRSRDAARPTQVEFINHGKEIKTIYWLNYEGHRVYYTRLQPGDRYIQKTYVSHPWVVTSDDLGTCETAVLPVRTPASPS